MDEDEPSTIEITRRTVIEAGTTALLLTTLPRAALAAGPSDYNEPPPPPVTIELQINGHSHPLTPPILREHPMVRGQSDCRCGTLDCAS
jgi:xanthine dehydrogenase YagT iron-sulfur-binding subunit